MGETILSCDPNDINPWGCDLVAVILFHLFIFFSPPFSMTNYWNDFDFVLYVDADNIISSSVHSFSSLVFFQVLLLSTFSCCVAV